MPPLFYTDNKMIKKRFIAGAVCPRCAAMDRLVMYEDDGRTVRECVECGFSDAQAIPGEQEELKTRVNHQTPPEPEEDIQLIKILK